MGAGTIAAPGLWEGEGPFMARSNNPVGRPRRDRGGEGGADTRDQILDRTEDLLEERGYAGMSMDDVARAAGLTKGTLYHHFEGGKDALILAVAQRMLVRHWEGLASAIGTTHGVHAQLEAVATWTLAQSGRPERILRDTTRFLPEAQAQEMARGFMTHIHAQVQGLFEQGARRGELPPHDTEFAAWAFMGLLAEFSGLQALFVRPHLGRQIVDLMLTGLGPGHEPESA